MDDGNGRKTGGAVAGREDHRSLAVGAVLECARAGQNSGIPVLVEFLQAAALRAAGGWRDHR